MNLEAEMHLEDVMGHLADLYPPSALSDFNPRVIQLEIRPDYWGSTLWAVVPGRGYDRKAIISFNRVEMLIEHIEEGLSYKSEGDLEKLAEWQRRDSFRPWERRKESRRQDMMTDYMAGFNFDEETRDRMRKELNERIKHYEARLRIVEYIPVELHYPSRDGEYLCRLSDNGNPWYAVVGWKGCEFVIEEHGTYTEQVTHWAHVPVLE